MIYCVSAGEIRNIQMTMKSMERLNADAQAPVYLGTMDVGASI